MTDDIYWFLKPPAEIKKLIDDLPPQSTPDADHLLNAIQCAHEKECMKPFIQSVIDYVKVGATFDTAIEAATEDWDLNDR